MVNYQFTIYFLLFFCPTIMRVFAEICRAENDLLSCEYNDKFNDEFVSFVSKMMEESSGCEKINLTISGTKEAKEVNFNFSTLQASKIKLLKKIDIKCSNISVSDIIKFTITKSMPHFNSLSISNCNAVKIYKNYENATRSQSINVTIDGADQLYLFEGSMNGNNSKLSIKNVGSLTIKNSAFIYYPNGEVEIQNSTFDKKLPQTNVSFKSFVVRNSTFEMDSETFYSTTIGNLEISKCNITASARNAFPKNLKLQSLNLSSNIFTKVSQNFISEMEADSFIMIKNVFQDAEENAINIVSKRAVIKDNRFNNGHNLTTILTLIIESSKYKCYQDIPNDIELKSINESICSRQGHYERETEKSPTILKETSPKTDLKINESSVLWPAAIIIALFCFVILSIVKRSQVRQIYVKHFRMHQNHVTYDFDSLTFRREAPNVLYDDHVKCEVHHTLKRLKSRNKDAYKKTVDLIRVVPEEHIMAVMDAINSLDKEENDNELYNTNEFEFQDGIEDENLYEELNVKQKVTVVNKMPSESTYSTISKANDAKIVENSHEEEICEIYTDPRDTTKINIDDTEVIDILDDNIDDIYADPVKYTL